VQCRSILYGAKEVDKNPYDKKKNLCNKNQVFGWGEKKKSKICQQWVKGVKEVMEKKKHKRADRGSKLGKNL